MINITSLNGIDMHEYKASIKVCAGSPVEALPGVVVTVAERDGLSVLLVEASNGAFEASEDGTPLFGEAEL